MERLVPGPRRPGCGCGSRCSTRPSSTAGPWPNGVHGAPRAGAAVLGRPWQERDLRLALERSLRTSARLTPDVAERVALVDRANAARPRTCGDRRPADEPVTVPLTPGPSTHGDDAATPTAPSSCPRCAAPSSRATGSARPAGPTLARTAAAPAPRPADRRRGPARTAATAPPPTSPTTSARPAGCAGPTAPTAWRPPSTAPRRSATGGTCTPATRTRSRWAGRRSRRGRRGAAARGAPEPVPVAAVVCDGVSSVPNSERAARAAADAALEHLLRSAGTDGERRTRAAVAAAAAAAAAVVPAGTATRRRARSSAALVEPVGGRGHRRLGRRQPGLLARGRGRRTAAAAHRATTRRPPSRRAPARSTRPSMRDPRADAITRWLGADGEPEPDVATLTPPGPGLLLLCSDGLWNYVPGRPRPGRARLPGPARRRPRGRRDRTGRGRTGRRRRGQHHRRRHPRPAHLGERAMTAPQFAVEVDQNPYLAAGATRVDAVVTVTAAAAGAARPPTRWRSSSSTARGRWPASRIALARQATAAAIAEVRDGVAFAVIAGNHTAQQVYPRDRDRPGRRRHPGRGRAGGAGGCGPTAPPRSAPGCAWPARSPTRHPDAVRHAILLTDGQNGERRRRVLPRRAGLRRRVHLRLPRRRHRLAGRRAAHRSRRRCSAPSTSSPIRPTSPPTSAR